MRDGSSLRRSPYVWLTLILLLGFALRIYALGDVAVNNDESLDYHRYVANSFQTIMVDDLVLNNHPFSYIMSRASILLLSDNLFALRWPALIISMLGIAAIYRLAQELFDQRTGLFSALLLALSPFAIFFAHSFRGYNGVINLPIIVYLLGFLALQTGRWRYWIGLSLLAVVTLYTHLFTTLAYLNLLLLIAFLLGVEWQRSARRPSNGRVGNQPPATRNPQRPTPPYRAFATPAQRTGATVRNPQFTKFATSVALTILLMALLYAPVWTKLWQPAALPTAAPVPEKVLLTVHPSVSASVWYNLWLYNGYWQKGSQAGYGVFILLGLGAVGGWLGFANQARRRVLALVGWAFLPFAQLWLLQMLFAGFWARPPYLGYTLAPLLILAGLGMAGLFSQKKLGWPLLAVVSLLLIGLWVVALREYYQVFAGANWQAIGNLIQRNARPDDLVICHQYRHAWRDVDVPAENICTRTLNYRHTADTPLTANVMTSHTLIFDQLAKMAASGVASRVGRVWVVVWDVPEAVDLTPVAGMQAEFNQYGRSFVLLADRPQPYVENLYRALAALRATVPAGKQRFIYDLMDAPLAAASDQPKAAAGALADAERDRPDHPDSHKKLAQTEALVATLTPDSPEHRLSANFGDAIVLQGYTLSPKVIRPGTTVNLTLFWQATNPVPDNYSIFLHLRDQAGNIVAQTDYQPFNGAYPTRNWQVGQRLTDRQSFPLPPDMPPADYTLVVGLYNPDDLTRLRVIDDQSGENAVFLTTLALTGAP